MSTALISLGVVVLIAVVATYAVRSSALSAQGEATDDPDSLPAAEEPVDLEDPCALLSAGDASTLVGASVGPARVLGPGMCAYFHSEDQGVVVAVQSLPGADGAKIFKDGIVHDTTKKHLSLEALDGLGEFACFVQSPNRTTLFARLRDKNLTLGVANSPNPRLKNDMVAIAKDILTHF